MTRWAEPEPGLVIRYSYLWRREQEAGRKEGVKDRPCAIVLALVGHEDGRPRVVVLPVTHTPPQPPTEGVELPAATKRRLGLDEERSWVVTSEANSFLWPGPDIRFLPGGGRRARFMAYCRPTCSVPSETDFSPAIRTAS